MVLRVTQKLAKKLKIESLPKSDTKYPAFEEWHCNLLVADRKQYIIVTNSSTLYTIVIPGKGIHDLISLNNQLSLWLMTILKIEGLDYLIDHLGINFEEKLKVFATNSRSVLATMNDFTNYVKSFIIEGGLENIEISHRLNKIPCGNHKYKSPNVMVRELTFS